MTNEAKCKKCKGSGQVVAYSFGGPTGYYPIMVDCYACEGTGTDPPARVPVDIYAGRINSDGTMKPLRTLAVTKDAAEDDPWLGSGTKAYLEP